jgi:cytochrome c553
MRRIPLRRGRASIARRFASAAQPLLVLVLVLAGVASALLPAQAADEARVQDIIASKCFGCHGLNGEGSTAAFPRLAGQNAAYLARQMADYKTGRRKNPAMQAMVEDLNEAEFKALATFFAAQPVRAHRSDAPAALLAVGEQLHRQGKAGVAACASCHGPGAEGSEQLPRLAGQHALYLENQLRRFASGERRNDAGAMHPVAKGMAEAQMKAVAAYLSALK